MSKENIVRLFELFYAKVYKGYYKIDLSLRGREKYLSSFYQYLLKKYPTAGNNLVIDYFSFAFSYYASKNTKRDISFNWIVSKKMLDRYIDQKEGQDFYVNKFLREYSIVKNDILSILHESIDYNTSFTTNPVEEIFKKKYANGNRFYHCFVMTTLYNHRSKVCMLCKERELCKKILKQTNPALFNNRGYV